MMDQVHMMQGIMQEKGIILTLSFWNNYPVLWIMFEQPWYKIFAGYWDHKGVLALS